MLPNLDENFEVQYVLGSRKYTSNMRLRPPAASPLVRGLTLVFLVVGAVPFAACVLAAARNRTMGMMLRIIGASKMVSEAAIGYRLPLV